MVSKIQWRNIKMVSQLIPITPTIKRLKILSYFELSVGVPCIVLACLPIWTEEQKNIKNLLLGTGTASAASGLMTFTFTINF